MSTMTTASTATNAQKQNENVKNALLHKTLTQTYTHYMEMGIQCVLL